MHGASGTTSASPHSDGHVSAYICDRARIHLSAMWTWPAVLGWVWSGWIQVVGSSRQKGQPLMLLFWPWTRLGVGYSSESGTPFVGLRSRSSTSSFVSGTGLGGGSQGGGVPSR